MFWILRIGLGETKGDVTISSIRVMEKEDEDLVAGFKEKFGLVLGRRELVFFDMEILLFLVTKEVMLGAREDKVVVFNFDMVDWVLA